LRQALRDAAAAGVTLTDEASAMEWAGMRPQLVPCHKDNIKITYVEDLQLAELILQAQMVENRAATDKDIHAYTGILE
jgi:2-C-methyl-D-erythritol 4-phosphate cytidylyltransferase